MIENLRGDNRQGETFWVSFLTFHACNDQHEWLILPFRIESNLFKLLCIEMIFKYNILFLIDNWYCHFILNACFIMILILRFD